MDLTTTHRTAAVRDVPRRSARPWAQRATSVRIGLSGVLGLLLVVVARNVFDRSQWVLAVVPIALTLTGWATVELATRWRVAAAAAAAAAALVVIALVTGAPVRSIPGDLARGPRQLLSTEWPSPAIASLVVAVGGLLALITAVAVDLAGRHRWHLAPIVPAVVGYVVLLALGAPLETPTWLLAAIGLCIAGLALVPVDDPVSLRWRVLAGDRTLAVTAVAAAAVGLLASAVLGFSERADPRRVDSMAANTVLVDPIEATIALREVDPPFTMFEVEDRSEVVTPVQPSRWRIVALDEYDGQRWVPEVTLRPIGGRLDPSPPDNGAPQFDYRIEYRSDDIDLVPFPGNPISVDLPVETDVDRVAVRLVDEPTVGLTVDASAQLPPSFADAGPLATRAPDEIAETFAEVAEALGGTDDLRSQLALIERTMRESWVLDSRAPGGGQQLKLLERFIMETNQGTREQFVTTFVLLARSLGVDARVGIGFEVEPSSLGTPLVIRSDDATSWPEVRLVDGSWLSYDPVPASELTLQDADTLPPNAQSPAAAQPPAEPITDDDDDDEPTTLPPDPTQSRWVRLLSTVGRFGSVVGLAFVPILIAVATIQLAKTLRRRRRLREPDPYRRVRGAWANATDSLVDAGLDIETSWTDDRIAIGGIGVAPSGADDLRHLAELATAVTFDPSVDAHGIAGLATELSERIDEALRRERTRLQRLRWRLSLRSLRPATRSPIVV